MRRWISIVALALVVAAVGLFPLVRADEKPADSSASATQPTLSADAKPVLESMDKAYGQLQQLTLKGSLSMDSDVSGETQTQHSNFTTIFQAPNLFRQEVEKSNSYVYGGETIYEFEPRRNIYTRAPLAKEKMDLSALPATVHESLSSQNPSLLMAISKTPTKALLEGSVSVDKGPDVTVDNKSYTSLVLKSDGETATILVDPQTHLIRRLTSDFRDLLVARGADAVKKAQFVIDYETIDTKTPVKSDAFAWVPPDGARDLTTFMKNMDQDSTVAKALLNQPAPDFTLETLGDKPVKLSDLKGKVVVLDFWATWCPPCMASLPGLNTYYEKNKDRGLEVVAIDAQEKKATVQQVVDAQKWTFTVALDSDGHVGDIYMIDGYPTTMVVDKQGIVRDIIFGEAPEQAHAHLAKAVEAALK